ncbi:unnamed protein product [Nippostrongylus brasiliensis]|uniref:Uncharacterized protein n=1 Tax=Nippostrongylus brasiliensis TaxID=27835 RepID=A0A3P7AGC3_NIPBR|nr:unnamed protein product [Nippostrongylus brasiliensis]
MSESLILFDFLIFLIFLLLFAASPYYLYEKRGGGRAFVGAWQPYDSIASSLPVVFGGPLLSFTFDL